MYFRYTALAILLPAAVAPAQANLIITPVFDTSISSDTNAAAIEASIESAILPYETSIRNSIDVFIYFQESSSGLGGSNFYDYVESYRTVYNNLVSNNANPSAVAGLRTADAGNNNVNPVTGSPNIAIKSADARALGINITPGCVPVAAPGGSGYNMECGSSGSVSAVDGIVSLNTGLTFPPGSNGSGYALKSVVQHEIDEILGLGSSLNNTSASSGTVNYIYDGVYYDPSLEDLYRYNSSGKLIKTSVNCASPGNAYFSYSGASDLTQFNNSCNGADFGDWASSATPQVQDAYGTPGASPALGVNELSALSAIGYQLATPEPATPAMFLGGVFLIAALRRRGSRGKRTGRHDPVRSNTGGLIPG